jgi:serine phosphatase RsbU (regulator of sigma subunit)
MDATFAEEFGDSLFVTAQIADLDLATGRLEVHTAGHPPPVLFRPKASPGLVEVRPGLPLGLGPSTYRPAHVQLQPGDAVLMVSDGIYEARSADGTGYGWDRVLAVVQDRIDAGDPSPEVLRRLARDVLDYQDGNPRDDTSAVLVRWRPDAVGLPEPPSAANVREAATPGDA